MNYKIKHILEDFVVREVPLCLKISPSGMGEYTIMQITKKYITSFEMMDIISRFFMVKLDEVRCSGLKDEDGITTQYVSIHKRIDKNAFLKFRDELFSKNIFLESHVGFSEEPLKIGSLLGNCFEIVLRDINPQEMEKILKKFTHKKYFLRMINYYDDQRFGLPEGIPNTHLIGKYLLEGDWDGAIEEYEKSHESKKELIQKMILDSVKKAEIIKKIEPNQYTFYMNSYMSYLWNQEVSNYILQNSQNGSGISIPCTSGDVAIIDEKFKKIFIETSLPYYYFSEKNGEIIKKQTLRNIISIVPIYVCGYAEDEIFVGKSKIKICFFLNSGSYATMAVKQLTAVI